MPLNYDAILFDFDGVLSDSEPVHFECWREILGEHGVDLDWPAYVEQGIGISDRRMLSFFCNRVDPPLKVERLIAEYPRKRQMFLDRMLADPRVLPEVQALVRELATDYKLAVVSSSGQTEVEPLLKAAGIFDSIAVGVYGRDVKNKKPAPDPYLLAMERLQAKKGIVVEDSDAGETSARTAGLDVVRVYRAEDVPRLLRAALNAV